MKLTGNNRIRGEFDSVDLIAGILIALCIPTLTYFVLRNTGVAKKSDPQGYLKKAGLARPDSELVAIQLEYFEKVYTETGKEFLRRAQQSKGVQRLNEKDWAMKCFMDLVSKLVTLENNIKSEAGLEVRLASELNSIRELMARIQLDLDAVKQS
jgi:hypothetical protein|tara:strand:+ start:1306 stop:1767 length:462 start_codon:yes stop_codon:yes gene_type:complete